MAVKVGLALGSGAARGLAHIGVIKALEEAGIKIDAIAGTSIGAVIGGSYAAGISIERLTEFAIYFGSRNRAFWLDPSFFFGSGGLVKGSKIEDSLRELTGPLNFADLQIPFYVITTDLITGREIVITEGDLHTAIRASFSIPGIFSPVKYDEKLLADGAIVAPIPTRILKEKKCDVVIAINVGTAPKKEAKIETEGKPGLFEIIIQSLSITQQRLSEHCMDLADINIIPPVGDYSWTDFSNVSELIEVGYEATQKALPAIKRLITSRKGISFLKQFFHLK